MPIPFLHDHRFASPEWLWLLLVLPLLLLARGRKGRAPAAVFSSLQFLREVGKPVRHGAGWIAPSITLLTLALGIVALARPQRVEQFESVTSEGIEIILALDLSSTMEIPDFFLDRRRINRLTAAKRVTLDFIKAREADRMGILAFAAHPYLASPLTADQDWLERRLRELQIGMIEDGTAIGSAIAAAAERLSKREAKSKVVVLVTDGESNAGKLTPVTAAELANTLGIRIYAIAVGTDGRHNLPGMRFVQQSFDFDTLKQVAALTGGKAFLAQDTDTLAQVFKEIDTLERTEVERLSIIEVEELFRLLVLASLGCAILALLLHTLILRLP